MLFRSIFADIRDHMIPFESGDLLRLPFAGEMYGNDLLSWCEPDGHEQWPLMQNRLNRLASRRGEYEWGWLQNKDKASSTDFCHVDNYGDANRWDASGVIGVRPAFTLKIKRL